MIVRRRRKSNFNFAGSEEILRNSMWRGLAIAARFKRKGSSGSGPLLPVCISPRQNSAYLNWKFAMCIEPSFNFTISFRQVFFHAELVFRM